MAARRRTTTRRAPAKKTARPAPTLPITGPGEHIFVLSVPYEERAEASKYGATWNGAARQTLYVGQALPWGLKSYASPDFSWERWIEDDLNHTVRPTTPSGFEFTARPHQIAAADKIEACYNQGYRGFLEADDVGLGKTLSALFGALRIILNKKMTRLLIVCPKGVIAHWRNTLASVNIPAWLRIVVINYDQSKKLLTVPASAAAAKRTATKNRQIAAHGNPIVDWDLVILDESHKCKNQESQRTQAVARIARYSAAAAAAPFVIWMSATAGQNPVELGYLSPMLAQLIGGKRSEIADWGQWLLDHDYGVEYNERFGTWRWITVPTNATPEQQASIEQQQHLDIERMYRLLFAGPDAPSIRRSPTDLAGWPAVQRIPWAIELTPTERRLYQEAWTQFRTQMRLYRSGRDAKSGMVARLRFRQKASLLRVAGTVDLVADLVENGRQVVVSCEFIESLDQIREGLAAQKITCAEFSGVNAATREGDRLTFQRGQAQVILITVTEGISLHAGEVLPGGEIASRTPRETVIHDPRYSGIDALQIEGRAHRDGQNSNAYYSFAAGTVEAAVVRTQVGRVRTTKAMQGDDTSAIQQMEVLLDNLADSVEDAFEGASGPGHTDAGRPEQGHEAPLRLREPVRVPVPSVPAAPVRQATPAAASTRQAPPVAASPAARPTPVRRAPSPTTPPARPAASARAAARSTAPRQVPPAPPVSRPTRTASAPAAPAATPTTGRRRPATPAAKTTPNAALRDALAGGTARKVAPARLGPTERANLRNGLSGRA